MYEIFLCLCVSAACAEKAAGHHRAPPAETGTIRLVQQQQVVPFPALCLSLHLSPSPWSSQWDPSMLHLHHHGNLFPWLFSLTSSSLPFPPCQDNYATTAVKQKAWGLSPTLKTFKLFPQQLQVWLCPIIWVLFWFCFSFKLNGSRYWPVKLSVPLNSHCQSICLSAW